MDIKTSRAIKLFFPNPALIQVLYESVANSLDAGATEVSIHIEIDSFTAADTLRITITDNGDGFDQDNFARFCELLDARDANHKGLGRLVYLNYFARVDVDSRWEGFRRTFQFTENFDKTSILDEIPADSGRETKLIFSEFIGKKVKSYDDLKPGALKEKLLGHFLPTLFQRKQVGQDFRIHLTLDTDQEREDKDFISTHEDITPDDLPNLKSVRIQEPSLDAYEEIEMLYEIRPATSQREILTAASIDGRTIPLRLLQPQAIPTEYSLICLFVSPLFGVADNSRQKLELPENISEAELRRILQRELGKVLEAEIEKIAERNEKTEASFEEKFPHLLGYFEPSAVGLIDRDEALEVAQRRFFRDQKEVLQADELDEETFEKSLELSSRSLTEYILYREKIIRRMKAMTAENSEADIHNLIVPRYQEFKREGFLEAVYRNNAWLLDDKFMSFQTILSEGQMDSVIEAITLTESQIKDEGRPDIAMIFSNDPASAEAVDVVIVELKKITDEEKDNQFVINQLLSRARKLVAHCPNIQHVWYYAVIHIDAEMEEVLLQQDFAPLYSKGTVFYREFATRRPDGSVAPTPTFVMSYDAIIGDAECRNHTFLEILRSGMKALERTEETSLPTPAPPVPEALTT